MKQEHLSRGQKKRLERQISKFASKQALEIKHRTLKKELSQAEKLKQKELAAERKAKETLDQGFMDVDDQGVISSSGDKMKNTFQKMDGMLQSLNTISKKALKAPQKSKSVKK